MPPIWKAMLLSYQFRCGELILVIVSPMISEKLLLKIRFRFNSIWRQPFNWHRHPIGYVFAVTSQWIAVSCVCFSVSILLAVGIAFFLLMFAITKDLKCILKVIEKNSCAKTRRKQIFKQFAEFIDLHAAIKQLSFVVCGTNETFLLIFNGIVSDFSDLYKPAFITLFLRGILSSCCALLIIQLALVEYKFTSISTKISILLLGVVRVFLVTSRI